MMYQDLLNKNSYNWNHDVKTPGVFYEYCRMTPFQVLKQNPQSSLLKELNKFVITLDSQCELEGKSTLPSKRYLSQYYLGKEYRGKLYRTIQRPYVEFVCTIEKVKKLMEIDDKYIGIIYQNMSDHTLIMNNIMRKQVDGAKINLTKDVFEQIDVKTTNHWIDQYNNSLDDFFEESELFNLVLVRAIYKSWKIPQNYSSSEYLLNKLINALK